MSEPLSREHKSEAPAAQEARGRLIDKHETRVALYIAFLAALLAIASMIDDEGDKSALEAHLEATNQFAFYQAKNIRSNESNIAALTFESLGKPELAREWRGKFEQHEADKKEILAEARRQQDIQKLAVLRGDYYKVGVALLQIAIVIASASLITSGSVLFIASAALTAIATLYMINGLGLFTEWLPTDPAGLIRWVASLLTGPAPVTPPPA